MSARLTKPLCTFLCQTNVQYLLNNISGSTITRDHKGLHSNHTCYEIFTLQQALAFMLILR